MKSLLFYLLLFLSLYSFSQTSTQVYSYGGKDLKVNSKYDCSEKYTLTSSDFAIASVKIPKFVYNNTDVEELNEEFSKEIEKEVSIQNQRKVGFKSFGYEFEGYLYKLESKGKISFFISSFGMIENAIFLTIAVKNENLDFNNFELPTEISELINITELK